MKPDLLNKSYLGLLALTMSIASPAVEKPNILFILSDDQAPNNPLP